MSSFRIARGVRLKRTASGQSVLLVPEGIVELSETAADTIALVDGTRDAAAIARELSERYEDPADDLLADVSALLEAFEFRGYVTK